MRVWKFQSQFSSRKRRRADAKLTKPNVQCWSKLVEKDNDLNALSLEAQLLWDAHGGDKSKAKSFWIGKEDTPNCLLERFALQVGEFHSIDNFQNEDAFLGVEFWVQLREGNYNDKETEHGLEFHFDKDEVSAAETDSWFHPAFSTVTYLNNNAHHSTTSIPPGGVPLVIYSTPSFEDDEKEIEQEFPGYSWIVNPQPNRHVVFPGNLLHGCPTDLVQSILYRHALDCGDTNDDGDVIMPDKQYSRLSLAVNIWTKRIPKNLQRLNISTLLTTTTDKSIIKQLNKNKDTLLELNTTQKSGIKKVKVDSKMGIDNLFFPSEHKEGDTAPLPIAEISREFIEFMNSNGLNGGKVVSVKYCSD